MLGRRACAPRDCVVAFKGKGDSEPLAIDPAVDLQASDLDAYRESLWDTKHLAYHPGQTPTLLRLQPLTVAQKEASESITGQRKSGAFWFQCGVTQITNYQVEKPDGSLVELPQVVRREEGRLGWMITDAWMAEANLPAQLLVAVHLMLLSMSEAQLPLSRPSGQPSGLPGAQ